MWKLYLSALLTMLLVTLIGCSNLDTTKAEIEVVDISSENTIITIKINTCKEIQSPIKKEFTVTYYTSMPNENSLLYGSVNCIGEPLGSEMMIASNYYPLYTKINLDGYGELEVRDRGSSRFDCDNRIDLYIPILEGENSNTYYKRVQSMGVDKVIGFIK